MSTYVLRYLKDSMENETDRVWSRQMHSLIQEMIHYRNGIPESDFPDPEVVSGYEKRYREILSKAKEEYDDVPPGTYYRDGSICIREWMNIWKTIFCFFIT